jgi:hypothetical protein
VKVNLGVRLSRLFTAVFKLSNEGKMALFYEEDGQSLYCLRKRSAKYVEEFVTALYVNTSTLPRRINIDAPTTIYL